MITWFVPSGLDGRATPALSPTGKEVFSVARTTYSEYRQTGARGGVIDGERLSQKSEF